MNNQIVTVTFNPCIDKSVTVPALAPEKKLRCSSPMFEPGGGGINVSRAIQKLGGNSIAVYPSGGYSGKFLDVLLGLEKVNVRTVETKHHTRENLIALDTTTNLQYRFGMPGQTLLEEEWQQCLKILEELPARYIVASGSLAPGVPQDIYARIAKIADKKNAHLVVDSSDESLQYAMENGAYLVKPNLGELSKLAGKENLEAIEIEGVAKELLNKYRCEIIVVSMGTSGATLLTRKETYHIAAPMVRRKSTVGAGDSMVAGLVLSLSRGENLHTALEYGVACGTAATMNMGTQLCNYQDVKKLLGVMRGIEA